MLLDAPHRSRPLPRRARRRALAALLLACIADAALAQGLAAKARESGCVDAPRVVEGATYKCTTASGAAAYFNVPDPVPGEKPAPRRPVPAGTGTAPPANLPRVDAATQKGRDELRRKVLQDELAAEEKLLGEARTAYASGAPAPLPEERGQPQRYAERIARLRQSVQLHERNVEALRKELGAPRARRDARAVDDGSAPVTALAPASRDDAPGPWPGLEMLSTAVLLLSAQRVVLYANAAAEHLFELSRARLCGFAIGALFADARLLAGAIDSAVGSGAAYTEQEIELGIAGKPRLHLAVTATPVDHAAVALILELRQIDQQLKIAREERQLEQQEANRELIRNLAHEIKNPLGGIRGAAQLLERELERPQLSEYTQVIIQESDRLQSLVNRLLTPHRLPTYRRTNVHEVLVRVKGVVQAEFPAIPIEADFDISLPEIEADPEQLTQAVLNVVRNAAQALSGTTADPRIALATRVARYVTLARRRHRLALAISVTDNGPGIPPAIRERIFYPLVSGREGGSGLGLTIAQTFVAQHGGTIECESEPGRTVFRILLPVDFPRSAAHPAAAA